MKTKAFYLLAVIALAVAFWLSASGLWGVRGGGGLFLWLIAAGLLVPALAWAARKMPVRVWIFAGLVNLAALLLPASILVKIFPARWSGPLGSTMALTLLLIVSLALVIAALLLHSGLNLFQAWRNGRAGEGGDSHPQGQHVGRTAFLALGLGSLLLAKALHSFYWFMVWDTTTDPLGAFWLAVPIPAVLYASIVLSIVLPGKLKLAGFSYVLLIPAVIAVSSRAQRVDYRQLTEERAGRASQALEAYYTREGRYPPDLQRLTPWYALTLPGPVTIYGQDWCYDGGEGYYRLGYVYREQWSDPHLTARTYRTEGQVPDLGPICDREITTLQKRYPQDYGTDLAGGLSPE
jgi:hypothetical protein